MFFYLTPLNLTRYLIEEPLKPVEDDIDVQAISVMEAWNSLEFLCQNYIINFHIDSLYNVYNTKRMTKEL